MKKGRTKITRFLVMLVTAAMLWSNVQPMAVQAATTGDDVGVISVKTTGNKIKTTLYGYSGSSVTTDVSFYLDGQRVEQQTGITVQNGKRVTVTSKKDIVAAGDDLHHYTVVISDDANWSNNNRTLVKGQRSEDEPESGSGSESEPDVEVPQQTAKLSVQSVSWSPENPVEGDEVTFTVNLSNTGDAAASNVSAKVTVDDTALTGTVDSISAGGSATLKLTGTWTPEAAESYDYSVEVTADNNVSATGAGVITVSAKPEATVKSAALTCTEKSSDSMTLAWSLNDDGTESPDLYVINVTANEKTVTYTSTAVGYHIFSHLTPETEYTCVITAKKDGVEKSTATIKVTTDKAAVEEETTVKRATASDSGVTFSTVTLSWGYDSSSEGEVPTEYTIKIGNQTYTRTSAGTEVFTGLYSGTTYAYTITAVNGSATSTVSGSITTKSSSELTSGVDIVVSDIIWEPDSPTADDQVTFKAVITNQGSSTSNNAKHGVRFYVDNQATGESCGDASFFWSDEWQSSLSAGQSAVITVNGNYNMGGNVWTATAGTHTITAFVDDSGSSNVTGDDNRNNNYRTENFKVTSAQPPVGIPVDTTNSDNVNVAALGSYGDKENSSISILVNGKESACLNAWVNTSCIWNQGHYETTPLTIFEMKSESVGATVRLALPSNKQINSVVVRPISAGIDAKIVPSGTGSYVEFKVNKWGSYSVEFNGETSGALQVFVNPDYTNNKADGAYLPLGTITWDAGAFGGSVYGSGILCSSHQGAVISPGSGARYNGVTILNEYKDGYGGNGSWEVEIRDKSNVEFNYFHIIACSPNSDGISVQSSNNIRINNSYFRTWDDGIAIKNYSAGNYSHTISVNDTVYWTDLAQSMEIGAETNKGIGAGPYVSNVRFNNITVIHTNHKPSISIHNMDNAAVSDVHWNNVVVEDACMGNNFGYGDGWPIVIDLGTYKGGTVPGTDAGWTRVGESGSITNVTLTDIKVLGYTNSDTVVDGLETGGATGKAPGIRVRGDNISNITITNWYIGDTKIDSWSKARSETRVADATGNNEGNVTFK